MQIFVGVDGELYSTVPGSGVFTLHDDLGLTVRSSVRPCFAQFGKATIITGKFTRPVVYYDDLDAFYPAGLEGPTTAPTVASGGAGNVTGDCVYYYTFVHEAGGVKRAESNPSPASSTFSASSNDVDLSAIETSAPDDRVNKVYIYCERDGAIARKVGSINLGVATFTDNMASTTLAEQVPLPVKLDADGITQLDTDARGIPPDTHICIKYNGRGFYGRDPNNPDYIWYSYLNEPEAVNRSVVDPNLPPLGTLRTRGREGVRGFVEGFDELMVGHEGGWDGVQGYGASTFQVRRMARRYAPLNHHSITVIGDGMPVWAAKEGVCGYDGRFRNLMARSLRSHWVAAYKAARTAYQDSVGADDSDDGDENVWKLLIPDSGGPSIYYVLHYDPLMDGGAPVWSFDREAREVTFIGNLSASSESRSLELHHMGVDGYLREKDTADNDDDSDTYLKHFEVWTKAFLPRGEGGDDGHGVSVTDLTLFLKNENQAVTVAGHGGGDEAHAATAQWSETVPAGAATVEGVAASSRTTYHLGDVPDLSGKSILFKIGCDSPVGVEFRGLEFSVRQGSNMRPA